MMDKHEAAVMTAYTGIMVGSFSDFHAYAERIMDRPIWTHQFASKKLAAEIKAKAEPDFMAICESIEQEESCTSD